MRITTVAAAALLLFAPLARAASRVVVLPVVVGSGTEPSAELMGGLAKGLQDNSTWNIVHGQALAGLMVPPAGLKDEDRARLKAKLDEAAEQLAKNAPKEAVSDAEAVRTELTAASKDLALVDADHELAYRAAGLLVAALAAAGETERAKTIAAETAGLFPGRKPSSAEKLPAEAVDLLTSAKPPGAVKLSFKTRPEGCEVFLNGVSVGKPPAEMTAAVGASYQAQAVCPGAAGAPSLKSFPKHITIGEKDSSRQELLDAEFERTFQADGGQRLRFASSPDRRQLEDSAARRVAERYNADVVVLASVGELSGADWLNGRLYLRSGYLNRQALVRLEVGRAVALGRYLATGREIPGVLKPEEAGALVAASQKEASQPGAPKINPWYTDIVGWCFTGVGVAGFTFGYLENAAGNKTSDQADAIRGDSERQSALYREAQRQKFIGGIGLIGGGLMAITGIVLLAIPEYTSTQGELFVLTPIPGGGAAVSLSGRF